MKTARSKEAEGGKLRIGDDWNAIRIIALSQTNPLKAIAEFVENSIDAHAKTIVIVRGREHGEPYLGVKDDGDGIPRGPDGLPDFKYVATHICDSIKRYLKADGAGDLQGELERSPWMGNLDLQPAPTQAGRAAGAQNRFCCRGPVTYGCCGSSGSHGFKRGTPRSAKSRTLRVTTVRL